MDHQDDSKLNVGPSLSRRWFLGLAAAAAGAGAIAGTGVLNKAYGAVSGGSSGKTFTVGSSTSLTGLTSAYQYLQDPALDVAVPEINATGGILGRTVKVDVRNNRSTPSTLPATIRYFASKGIHYMLGPEGSSLAVAAATAATQMKIIEGGWNDDASLGDASRYPYYYQPCYTTAQEAQLWVNYAVHVLKAKRIGAIATNDAFGQSGVAETKKVAKGLDVDLHIETIPINATSTDTYVSKLQDAGVTVLLLWVAPPPTMGKVFHSMATLSWHPPLIGHSTLLLKGIGQFAPKQVLDNVYVITYKTLSYTDKEPISTRVATYAKKVRKTKGAGIFGPATLVQSPAYDWFYLMKDAIESANTFDVASVKSRLDHTEYNGMLGRIHFTPSNHSGIPLHGLTLGVVGSLSEPASQSQTFTRRAPGL